MRRDPDTRVGRNRASWIRVAPQLLVPPAAVGEDGAARASATPSPKRRENYAYAKIKEFSR